MDGAKRYPSRYSPAYHLTQRENPIGLGRFAGNNHVYNPVENLPQFRPNWLSKLLMLRNFLFQLVLRRCAMNRFRPIGLWADIVCVLTVAFFCSATPALAKQCSAERPSNAQTYWSYRLIDGRKCWYEGKPMLSKSLLHWPAAQTAQKNPRREPHAQ